MLATLEVYNPFVTAAPLPIGGEGSAGTDAIQIRDIKGLGPVDATVSSSSSGTSRGEFVTGTTVGKRNIVLTLGFNPDWLTQTPESLRMMCYAYFMPQSKVRFVFRSTHMPDVEISGIVESCEPDIFNKEPVLVISVICGDCDFVATEPTSVIGVTTLLGTAAYSEVPYSGTVNTGFTLELTGGAMGAEFRIAQAAPSYALFRVKDPGVAAGKNLRISSVDNNKFIQLINTADGVITNALQSLRTESTWPKLSYGNNVLWIQTETAGLDWVLTYYARHGGL